MKNGGKAELKQTTAGGIVYGVWKNMTVYGNAWMADELINSTAEEAKVEKKLIKENPKEYLKKKAAEIVAVQPAVQFANTAVQAFNGDGEAIVDLGVSFIWYVCWY